MPFEFNASLNPVVMAGNYIDNVKSNFSDGYQFGDVFLSNFGKRNLTPSSARASDFENMSEREFADYEMREAHKLGVQADSSKYQRAYNDLLKAGLNPRLAIEALNGSGIQASSSYSASENKSSSKTDSYSSSAVVAALLVMAGKLLVKPYF